ncbi:hypothetical protein DSS3P1_01 [Ruegeria phage DSS3-P1]|uniref:hypothetical protein n=1 Tax=Ruegeria phage DSS3-P1 TaxID=1555208 RepID=UPI0002357D94|nr:hypothetical protein DSS3P1_01 [Ruegeria phage DSS3-P1]YP_009997218.1 hypothetical protein JT312_gp01 [Ruegeria phage vB_RpoS-V18]YP_009997300.1 hypothetical protein JT313_gp01 [Ruegeria phage vB_RpoS-V11]YP_009997382.1 hypothetical protein JT314_gp01 [Ruegeria phage vB_RpoS-V7]AET42336.1 hypothetical protein SDSG_00071 [Ruegeria phage DSS3-P1]AIT13236.1 hypothetical protein DSS3P1_01 [Ruegeria phage DSS3-P1]AWY08704.1 hypothetical protein vBRpoSV7_01 [Ruegeria phage vB_RpoS-V7]AWY08877.1
MSNTYTVAVVEGSTPLPPCYPDPLLYVVTVSDPHDSESILDQVAEARALELLGEPEDYTPQTFDALRAGLRLLFVLAGDVYPVADFRQS